MRSQLELVEEEGFHGFSGPGGRSAQVVTRPLSGGILGGKRGVVGEESDTGDGGEKGLQGGEKGVRGEGGLDAHWPRCNRTMDGTSQHRPAHQTKSEKILRYSGYSLRQSDDGTTNGTTLWLGGQILSAYLPTLRARAGKAIELGSGIGLSACGVSLLQPPLPSDTFPDSLSLHLAGTSWQPTSPTSSTQSSVRTSAIIFTSWAGPCASENLTGLPSPCTGPGTTRNQSHPLLFPGIRPPRVSSDPLST